MIDACCLKGRYNTGGLKILSGVHGPCYIKVNCCDFHCPCYQNPSRNSHMSSCNFLLMFWSHGCSKCFMFAAFATASMRQHTHDSRHSVPFRDAWRSSHSVIDVNDCTRFLFNLIWQENVCIRPLQFNIQPVFEMLNKTRKRRALNLPILKHINYAFSTEPIFFDKAGNDAVRLLLKWFIHECPPIGVLSKNSRNNKGWCQNPSSRCRDHSNNMFSHPYDDLIARAPLLRLPTAVNTRCNLPRAQSTAVLSKLKMRSRSSRIP